MKRRYTFLVVLFLILLIPLSLAMWHVIDPYSARTFQVSVFPTRGAILSLGELGDPRAFETLTRILLDTAAEVPVRAAAAEALGELGYPAAAEALEKVIEDRTNDEAVREAAVEALLAIEPDSEFGQSLARMLAVSGALSGFYEPDVSDRLMVKGLLDVVANGYHEECDSHPELDWDPEFDWALRLSAATALGKMGDPRAVERLLTILTDGIAPAKLAAAIALGGMKEPRAVKHFEAILAAPARGTQETDPVCDEAATALVRIEGSGAVEVLLQTLRKGSLPAKAAAVAALATLDDPRAADALLTIVSDRSKASAAVFRKRAAVALGKMEADKAVGPLVAMLRSTDASARAAAAIGLGYLGDRRAIGPLLEALTNPNVPWKDRETAAHVVDTLHAAPESGPGRAWYLVAMNQFDKLGDLGTDAVEPLVTALREADRGTTARCEAVLALRKIEGDRAVKVLAVEPLIALLHDKTAAVDLRHIAAVALGDLGEPRAIEPLIAVLTDPGSDEGVRAGAAEALGKCGDAQAVEPLIAALADARLHLWAAESLGEIGDPRAVEPLIEALKDEDKLVAGRAATALGKLGDRRAVRTAHRRVQGPRRLHRSRSRGSRAGQVQGRAYRGSIDSDSLILRR